MAVPITNVLPVLLRPTLVAVSIGNSQQGVIVFDSTNNYIFGQVEQLPDYIPSDFTVGDIVLFDLEDSINIFYQNKYYYIISQSDIYLIENPIIPSP